MKKSLLFKVLLHALVAAFLLVWGTPHAVDDLGRAYATQLEKLPEAPESYTYGIEGEVSGWKGSGGYYKDVSFNKTLFPGVRNAHVSYEGCLEWWEQCGGESCRFVRVWVKNGLLHSQEVFGNPGYAYWQYENEEWNLKDGSPVAGYTPQFLGQETLRVLEENGVLKENFTQYVRVSEE